MLHVVLIEIIPLHWKVEVLLSWRMVVIKVRIREVDGPTKWKRLLKTEKLQISR